MPDALPGLLLRPLGRVPYEPTFEAMRTHTQQRGPDSPDEIWLCQHQIGRAHV